MVTVNLRYKGADARAFAEEMTASGTVGLIRAETGNLRYEYLSNIEEIPFDQAYKSAGISSNSDDYFSPEEAILVEMS